jgi:hypothetical protein
MEEEKNKTGKSIRGEGRGAYVVPAMRHQQQRASQDTGKISSSSMMNEISDDSPSPATLNEARVPSVPPPQSFSPSSSSLKDSSSYDSPISNSLNKLSLQDSSSPTSTSSQSFSDQSLDYLSCCLLITGFSSSLPLETKENLIQQFYYFGGKSQWFRNHETEIVLFAFNSNQKAVTAMQQTELKPPLRVILFTDYDGNPVLKSEADPGPKSSLFLFLFLCDLS